MAHWKTRTGATVANDRNPDQGIEVRIRALEGNKSLYHEAWKSNSNTTTIIAEVDYEAGAGPQPIDGNLHTFRRHMLGSARAFGAAGTHYNRMYPEVNPLAPWQVCVACDLIDAYGNPIQNAVKKNWLTFDKYVYQCVFQGLPYETQITNDQIADGLFKERDRYTLWRRKTISREMEIPGGGFKIVDGPFAGQPIAKVGFRVSNEIEMQCTWFDVPVSRIPATMIAQCAGHVNSAAFTIDGKTWPIEAILFKGCEEERHVTATGDQVADLKMIFGIRDAPAGAGWNYFPDRTGGFHLVTADGLDTGTRMYRRADLEQLFIPEP